MALTVTTTLLTLHALRAQGVLTGDAGGNEREVRVFDRERGQVWHTITGVSGRFRSKPLAAGEYLAASGSHFTPVRIVDGRATELLFSSQSGMSADSETWSPARKKFGQTFRSVGRWVNGFRFWIPGEPIELVAELRKVGPGGALVGRVDLGESSWIRIVDLQPGAWPTRVGETYYLSIASRGGEPFRLGTPAVGDVYPHGRAWYDDQPRLDSDMGFSIGQDGDRLTTMVRVTLHQGFGFQAEGPAAGSPTWAAQTFVATARNLRTAWINAGWPSAEGVTKEFVFSVHEESATGPPVGPERRVKMVKDWGATAVWFADQVPLAPGKRYAVKLRREDGEPFYAYLAPDRYDGGQAVRAELSSDGMDLTCVLRGEGEPGSMVLPCNVRLASLTATSVTVAWETARPTTGVVELNPPVESLPAERSLSRQHRLTLQGLVPGVTYRYRVGGSTRSDASFPLFSKQRSFTSLEDPTKLDGPGEGVPSELGESVALVNPSFEDGTSGWRLSPASSDAHDPPLPDEVGNARAVFYLGRYQTHSGKRVLGWNHRVHERSGPVPRKIDPPVTRTVFQVVQTQPGREYVLSAWILTDERQGGWNRNDRVRLVVDPSASGRLDSPETTDEELATQWYTTRGAWRRYRLRFTATGEQAAVGVQLYQWWLLAENHVYVDDVALAKLPRKD